MLESSTGDGRGREAGRRSRLGTRQGFSVRCVAARFYTHWESQEPLLSDACGRGGDVRAEVYTPASVT